MRLTTACRKAGSVSAPAAGAPRPLWRDSRAALPTRGDGTNEHTIPCLAISDPLANFMHDADGFMAED